GGYKNARPCTKLCVVFREGFGVRVNPVQKTKRYDALTRSELWVMVRGAAARRWHALGHLPFSGKGSPSGRAAARLLIFRAVPILGAHHDF
ncbi:MAG: hypothetical protein WCP06_14270, partial [Verrucomicrobiota bacterium]